MKKGIIISAIILVVVALVVAWSVSSYNSLVTLNIAADTQWKQVEAEYQRRFDLIPNFVGSVQGLMKQEQAIFTAIAEARTQYSGAMTADKKAQAASQVEGALGRLLVITENYPQLKSSETVQSLMAELAGTENRIKVERARFNQKIEAYNLRVKRIPGSIVAAITGFQARGYFNAQVGAEDVPVVNF